MSTQHAEIECAVRHWLEKLADESMKVSGFVRSCDTLEYRRVVSDSVQTIKLIIEHHQIDNTNASAAMYPFYNVVMKEVNDIVREMAGGDSQLGGNFDVTLRGPLDFTAPVGLGARWFIYQPDSVPAVVTEASDFILKWTIPFLDRFRTPADLCNASLEGSRPDVRGMEVLRVVAAKVLSGQRQEALAIMERRFGRPGPRRKFKRVFDFLTAGQ